MAYEMFANASDPRFPHPQCCTDFLWIEIHSNTVKNSKKMTAPSRWYSQFCQLYMDVSWCIQCVDGCKMLYGKFFYTPLWLMIKWSWSQCTGLRRENHGTIAGGCSSNIWWHRRLYPHYQYYNQWLSQIYLFHQIVNPYEILWTRWLKHQYCLFPRLIISFGSRRSTLRVSFPLRCSFPTRNCSRRCWGRIIFRPVGHGITRKCVLQGRSSDPKYQGRVEQFASITPKKKHLGTRNI